MMPLAKKTGTPGDPHVRLPFGLILTVLTGLLLIAVVISSGMGFVPIAFLDVVRIVGAKATGIEGLISQLDALAPVVVSDVRLPRILTAALVGGGLAVSGAVFQGILLNPLADPYTLGVSAGAAFGASLALLLNFTLLGIWSVPVFAFAGAAATLMVVIYLTSSSGDLSSGSLILSGIIVAAILSAAVSFIKFLADDEVSIIIFWLMGSFASKTWAETGLVGISMALGLGVFLFFGRRDKHFDFFSQGILLPTQSPHSGFIDDARLFGINRKLLRKISAIDQLDIIGVDEILIHPLGKEHRHFICRLIRRDCQMLFQHQKI